MRISDWSSDVCSSDLKCHTERAAFEPRFQAASKRVHPGVQFAIGECACAGIPDLDEREIVLPAAEQHISEVLGHPGFSTNYKMVLSITMELAMNSVIFYCCHPYNRVIPKRS